MVRMIFLQVAPYLVACSVLCLHASDHSREKWKREEGAKLTQATQSNSDDCQVEEALNNLHSKLAGFPETHKILDELRVLLEEQKHENKDSCKSDKIASEEVNKTPAVTTNYIEKFQSEDPVKISEGVLNFVSIFRNLFDTAKPYSNVNQLLGKVVATLLLEKKPTQSVVDKLANVVHAEYIQFNSRLLDQKYNGLKRRVSEQTSQLQQMKDGEKLDDPNLWNDYAQFLGELAIRFESPLSFKYENNLSEDPDVKDYVTAVVKYSEAHSCFMALLFAVTAKYTELGIAYDDDKATVLRKMNFQRKDAKEKLSFLSENRYLTFLGKIEGGKLTKIVALSRRIRDGNQVETVRRSLGLSPMPNSPTVESSAKKVNGQKVILRSVENCKGPFHHQIFGIHFSILFINDVDHPIKIVSNKLRFVQNVPPRSRHRHKIAFHPRFSTDGYITLYLNGNMLGSNEEPPRKNSRVIEFAMSFVLYHSTIKVQDKTNAEFSRGHDTYNKRSKDAVALYFSDNGKYYIVKAEIFVCWPDHIWRFTIQDFDPEAVGELPWSQSLTKWGGGKRNLERIAKYLL